MTESFQEQVMNAYKENESTVKLAAYVFIALVVIYIIMLLAGWA